MNDDQLLLEHLAVTDEFAPDTPLPAEAWTRDAALAEIERRVGMQTEERIRPRLPERTRSRGWLVAAAAFVAVLIVGTVMLFWPGPDRGPVVVDTPTTTVPPTTTPPTTAPPQSSLNLPDTWQRVGSQTMTPVVGLFDMIATRSGLVAVGFDPGEEDFRQNGVIFSSADGVEWTRLAEDDPALNLGAVLVYGVTEGGPGLVAVGMGCEDDAEPCAPHATVWTSVDGTSWDRSAAAPEVFGELSALLDVVNTEHGLIGAGGFYTTVGETELIQPTVWFSSDGIEWERVWQGEAYDYSSATTLTGFQSLAADADGRVVGVGTAVNDEGEFVGAIWTSTNGRNWDRIDPNSEAFTSDTDSGISIIDVAAGSGGFVAVGSDGGAEVAIWHSPDGVAWTRADTTDQPFENVGALDAVDAIGTGWIAAGAGGTVTLWTSPDGLTWDRVHSIEPGYAAAIVATDRGIAVAGAVAGVDDNHAAVWAGPAFDPAAPPTDPGPAPEQVQEDGAPAPIEGLSCEELADIGLGYAETLSYWVFYERPSELDPDGNGAPCEAFFPSEMIEEIVGGADKLAVEILVDYTSGTFTAAGPAVDDGFLCPGGSVEFVDNTEPPPAASWRWEDLYTCDDGGGSFVLGANEFYTGAQHLAGVWDIASGTDGV